MVWIGLAGIVLLIGVIFLVDYWKIGGRRERERHKERGTYLTTRKVV